jgi:hypothetical protein
MGEQQTIAAACRYKAAQHQLERETGIEPVSLAWKAKVLPLNYSRITQRLTVTTLQLPNACQCLLVEKAGFEPA